MTRRDIGIHQDRYVCFWHIVSTGTSMHTNGFAALSEVSLRRTCFSFIALILFSALCHAENRIPVMTDGEPYMMEYDADSVTRSGSVVHLQTKITDSVNGTVFRYSMEIDCQKLNARNTRVAMYDPGADSPYFENDIDLPIPDIPGSFMDQFIHMMCESPDNTTSSFNP